MTEGGMFSSAPGHVLLTVNAAWNAWNFRRPLIRDLLDDGCRVTICAPPDDTVADLEALGCRFVPLPMDAKTLNPLHDLSLLLRLRRVFGAHKPDVVLSYTIKNNIFGALAARSLGVPFIPNVTGLGTAFIAGGVLRSLVEALYRRAFQQLPVVFFQNGDDRRLFVERGLVAPSQAEVVAGSGVDLTHFAPAKYPCEEEGFVFLMISRLLRDKGVIEFVEAARRVRAQVPRARFQLLGPIVCDNRTAIDAMQVDEWRKEGVVEYLGVAKDVRPFIAAAHCVVLPSYREGAPRTLIEAAAMARPVIATDVPGCRAVVDEGETGLFCAARDAARLERSIHAMMQVSSERRAAMGKAGRAKMEREFGEAMVADAYRSAFRRVGLDILKDAGGARDSAPATTGAA